MSTGLSSSSSSAAALFKIVACSYEGSLFGWNVLEDFGSEAAESELAEEEGADENTAGLTSALSFGFNCCQASLRAVAVSRSGKYLACGGADERIKLFNLVEGRAAGELSSHSGSITSIRFFNDAFMFVGSEVSLFIRLHARVLL